MEIHDAHDVVSRPKALVKPGIGALFLGFGLWTAFSGDFPASGTERALTWLWAAFLITGGAYWLAGKGEPRPVSMKARLALIFGLLALILCPAITLCTTSAADAKTGIIAGGITYILLGLPALILGHAARRTVASSAFLTGNGRATVALLIGYVCLCALGIDAVRDFNAHSEAPGSVPEPKTTSASVTPPAPQQSPSTISSPDVLGMVWSEQEYGRWHGKWLRRGLSNVFDAVIQNGDHGETKTFVAVVSHEGNAVHVESHDSSDGKNSVYDGSLSPDGRALQGTYVCNGGHYPFSVSIASLNHSYAKAGTYFLLAYKSVKTAYGVTGFPAGTEVTMLTDQGTTMLVHSDNSQFEVAKNEVTNDLDLARYIARADTNEQIALAAQASANYNADAEAKIKELQREADDTKRRISTNQPSAPARSSSTNPLDRGAYGRTRTFGYGASYSGNASNSQSSVASNDDQMKRRIDDLRRTQIDTLQGQVDNLRNTNPNDPNLARMEANLQHLRLNSN